MRLLEREVLLRSRRDRGSSQVYSAVPQFRSCEIPSMVRRSDFFKSAALSVGQQIGRMSSAHPELRMMISRNCVTWRGEIQPSPISSIYAVVIEYRLRRRPKVRVIQPELQKGRSGNEIPHTFSDGSVCLHRYEDSSPMMYISDTIVPWLALWLFYYEVWQATGQWVGGGD